VRRRGIVEAYAAALGKHAWAELPVFDRDGCTSSFHLFPLRIRGISEAQRDAILQRIFDRDVSVNVHFIPVPCMSFYRSLGYDIADYPVAYDNFSREISLPVFYGLTGEQLATVVETVVAAVEDELGKS